MQRVEISLHGNRYARSASRSKNERIRYGMTPFWTASDSFSKFLCRIIFILDPPSSSLPIPTEKHRRDKEGVTFFVLFCLFKNKSPSPEVSGFHFVGKRCAKYAQIVMHFLRESKVFRVGPKCEGTRQTRKVLFSREGRLRLPSAFLG